MSTAASHLDRAINRGRQPLRLAPSSGVAAYWFVPATAYLFFTAAASAYAGSPAILLFGAGFSALGALISRAFANDRKFVLMLFFSALVIRAVTAYFARFVDEATHFELLAFNPDANGYWDIRLWPLTTENLTRLKDPGFFVYNRLAYLLGQTVGGANYLANVQVQVVAGAVAACITYALCEHFSEARSGRVAGWLVALNPMQISLSAVLLRDAVVLAVGMFMLLAALRTRTGSRSNRVNALLLLVPATALLFLVRLASGLFFLLLSAVFVAITNRTRVHLFVSRHRRRSLVLAFLLVGVLSIVFVRTKFWYYLGPEMWQYRVQTRLELPEVEGSLAAKALQRGPIAWFFVATPLHFVAPFPFYSAIDSQHHFLYWFFGAGALVNQVLLVSFIAGGIWAITSGRRFYIATFIVPIVFAIASAFAFGDLSRYMSTHAYPFVAITTAFAIQRRDAWLTFCGWAVALAMVYMAYFALKRGML